VIFVTVGSQMPFDRLIRAVDEWAAQNATPDGVLAQIGRAEYLPRSMSAVESMPPAHFRELVQNCTVMVAHAGMGSILTALEFGKPIVVLPRRGNLRETRNDHQVATAQWLASRPGVFVAMEEGRLPVAIGAALDASASEAYGISNAASPELLSAIREFVAAD
jgi:UDP-N-acetylglucosamine transferase subunit ALG13